ncbi:hypothetical protein Godav_006469 [Gossypium davidsonii]|uniref:Uncharacterized protein n=2 Tax=Gossypium TaxID=3633 RepID=A0A7J8S4C5_GOSDV|nr:hypothetical protein [Gossypium davidsonii]MBA0620795.1 hypothetical protein [Gossypium davidsonii]MBA0656234.1 hypothetical protein [Gossypium klotzschianum]
MRPWRCTSRTEYYGNLDVDNRFPWDLRCLMIITKLTYGNCIRIGRDSSCTTSKCGKIGMIIYLIGNRSSFRS